MPRILIVVTELVIAVTLIVLLNVRDGSVTTDDVARWLDRGATWSVYAFLVTLGLIFIRRRYLWIEAIIVVITVPVTVWALTPTPGPDFGRGFVLMLIPGIMIGSGVSLLYKTGSLALSWVSKRGLHEYCIRFNDVTHQAVGRPCSVGCLAGMFGVVAV